MADYTQNSAPKNEAKPPVEKRLEKITTGAVKTKKSEVRKFADVFLEEDIRSIKEHFKNEVLIPRIKQFLYDAGEGLLDAVFNGRRSRSRSNGDRAAYANCYNSRDDHRRDDRRADMVQSPSIYDYQDLIFTNRGDIEDVLDRLDEMIEKYGMARVGDIYDAIGKSCHYTAYNYGWTDLSDARAVRRGDGFAFDMPKIKALR